MPTVTLKVTAEQRELWVEAAAHQALTLSEWLRQAATTRLGAGDQATSEPSRSPAPSRAEDTTAATVPEAEGTHHPISEPPASAQLDQKLAEARQLLQ